MYCVTGIVRNTFRVVIQFDIWSKCNVEEQYWHPLPCCVSAIDEYTKSVHTVNKTEFRRNIQITYSLPVQKVLA